MDENALGHRRRPWRRGRRADKRASLRSKSRYAKQARTHVLRPHLAIMPAGRLQYLGKVHELDQEVALLTRLQKYLAEAGVAARRKCEDYIRAGRVRVNGRVADKPGVTVDPTRDRIEVDGRPIRPERKAYVLLYKPRGYITTADDPRGRRKVTDLLTDLPERLFPVGRLDADSEGLLLLTNDGELAYRLTHPRFKVPKTYLVVLDRTPDAEALQRIASGLELDDGPTAPCKVRLLSGGKQRAVVEMTMHEGRNRQVRRMWAALGYRVKRLKRTGLADLKLAALRPGRHRRLRADELRRLRQSVDLT